MKISYVTCRIQFLNDVDPFGYSAGLEPTRPPSYVFNTRLPLGSQLPSVHRQLMAPQKVRGTVLRGTVLRGTRRCKKAIYAVRTPRAALEGPSFRKGARTRIPMIPLVHRDSRGTGTQRIGYVGNNYYSQRDEDCYRRLVCFPSDIFYSFHFYIDMEILYLFFALAKSKSQIDTPLVFVLADHLIHVFLKCPGTGVSLSDGIWFSMQGPPRLCSWTDRTRAAMPVISVRCVDRFASIGEHLSGRASLFP